MKILIINSYDIKGGGAIAAHRLHLALLDKGIDSWMLVQNKLSNEKKIISPTSKLRKLLNPYRPILDYILMKFYGVKTLFSSSYLPFSEIVKQINKINPDIVHLHWITGGMMKVEDIAKIKASIVWSLHDIWAFTGGCHYNKGCELYKDSCGKCPMLKSNKENDLSKKVFKRKQKVFLKKKDIVIVGLSNYLNNNSKNSMLLKNKKHINLPNPIDTNIFKQFDKIKARELWDLPQEKKLILFGAISATNDANKGFKELSAALSKLADNKIEFVVFGSNEPKRPPNFNFKTHYLGFISDTTKLIKLYNAVDIMVVPSLQENLSNTIMESLACGIPVVAFNIGGNSDMVEHKKNGYLAKPLDTMDLKNGIEWVLNHKNYDKLCENARAKVLGEFDNKIVAKKYIKLYEDIKNSA